MFRESRYAALGLGVALAAAGCAHCQQVKDHRAAFLSSQDAPPQEAASGPHLAIDIPAPLLDRWMSEAIAAVPAVPFSIPDLGRLAQFVGQGYSLSPRSLSMAIDRDDAARFDLDLDLSDRGRKLFGLKLGAVAPVVYDVKKGELRVSLRADLFEKIEPQIDPAAATRLRDSLLSQVPAVARGLLPNQLVDQVAARAVSALSTQAYSLLRRNVLSRIGELASFSVSLPDIPLTSIAMHGGAAVGGGLRVEARTPFAARGLPKLAANAAAPKGDRVRVRLATDAVARMGNWAMAKGLMPARFDSGGKPKDGGDHTAGLAWQPGERPLKVHLWSQDDAAMCLHAQAGGSPRIELKNGELVAALDDGKLEAITGPPLVQTAVDLLNIGSGAFKFSQKVAGKTELQVGSKKMGVSLAAARLDAEALVLELGVGAPRS